MAKGLALHESLLGHSSEDFKLHILTMDDATQFLLDDMALPNVELIPLMTFERELNLKPVRESRTHQEWCWTCASSLLDYILKSVGDCTYVDADIYWFADPQPIFDEIGGRSIGITPHRFPSHRKDQERNGIYNVGLVHAKNTEAGRSCISRWAEQCRDWCFNRVEEHHACGDQLYLDTWMTDYPGEVCAIENIGVNTAPWNLSQYAVTRGPKVNNVPIVCYHFHEFVDRHHLTNYLLREEDRKHIYEPYVEAWDSHRLSALMCEWQNSKRRERDEMESQGA
jgi:hypothetical protein